MPLNRYGGYGGYSSYSSNFSSSYGRSGSASPATLRATTPSRAFGSNSIINTILPEDRSYKISSYYSPGTYSRLYASDYDRKDLKTFKTEDLNTEEEREKERKHAIPGEITRDTTLNIRGGKPVVRIVTQKAKENPYINTPGWRSKIREEEERNNLTLGQRLALKHQIMDKPRDKEKSPSAKSQDQKKTDSGEESEWTWETCSSSSMEQDGYEYTVVGNKNKEKNLRNLSKTGDAKTLSTESNKRQPVVYSRSNTTTLCSTEDSTAIKQQQQQQQVSSVTGEVINSAARNRWLESMLTDSKVRGSSERISSYSSNTNLNIHSEKESRSQNTNNSGSSRPISWAGTHPLDDVQGNIHTKDSKPTASISSGSTSSSPPLYKYQPHKGGTRVLLESSDEEGVEVTPGWRPGQPPRGDVVVKMTRAKTRDNQSVINKDHSSSAKTTNKVLTSDKVISSKVPGPMNEKYSIPGLFIKPSTKDAPKSVEAKLTLSPVEGKISLTAKVKEEKGGSYQSSIYTPSKSPVMETKVPTSSSSSISAKDENKVSGVSLSSVVETGVASGEESEWEYYTESDPSDTEVKESKISTNDTKTVPNPEAKTKASVQEIKTAAQPSIPSSIVPNNLLKSKPDPVTPVVDKTSKKFKQDKNNSLNNDKSTPIQNKSASEKVSTSEVKVKPVKHPPEIVSVTNSDNKSPQKSKNEICNVAPVPIPVTINKTTNVKTDKISTDKTKDIKVPLGDPISKSSEVKSNQKSKVDVSDKSDSKDKSKSEIKSTTETQTSKYKQETVVKDIKDKEASDNKTINNNISQTVSKNVNNISQLAQDNLKNEVNKKHSTDNISANSQKHDKDALKVAKSDKTSVSALVSDTKSTESPKEKSAFPSKSKPDLQKQSNQETVSKVSTKIESVSTTSTKQEPICKATTNQKPVSTISQTNQETLSKVSATNQESVSKVSSNYPVPISEVPATNQEPVSKVLTSNLVSTSKTSTTNQEPESKVSITNKEAESKVLTISQEQECKLSKEEPISRTSSPENGMPATSVERLPSHLKNHFLGNPSPKSSPESTPKWYNNHPKVDPNDPSKAIAQMKNDFNKQVRKTSKEQETLIKVSNEPSKPWYDDEDSEEDDMKELLAQRPSILKEVDMNQDRRLTPEENTAVIKMYGGIMFPGGPLEKTPKNLLFKIRKQICSPDFKKQQPARDSGLESQQVSTRTNSTGSTSSTMSSFAAFSESPSPSPSQSDEDDDASDADDNNKLLKNPTNQAPTKSRPEFKKYAVKDFRFLRVLGKGSFGKVLLAELRNSQNFYAVKALRKDSILEDDDIECTMIERKVLALGVKHPFLCHLFCTLQTDSHLFFVMEYLNGGDLMFHIQQSGRFDTERARFYSAEIVCALKFLHSKGIVYRDLKLDNLLLDYEGHIRLVDFGMCKLQIYLDKTSDTFCGTPDYMAPEIIKGMKYTHSVDWWSFGVLLYEMLIGQSPFNGCDEDELFWSICNEQAYFPRFLSKEAKMILLMLLEKNPVKRLGVSDSVQGDIRHQPFFKPIDFYMLEKKLIVPPFKPKLKNPMDVSYFDTAFTDEPVKLTPVEHEFLENLNQTQFKGFSYTNKQYTS